MRTNPNLKLAHYARGATPVRRIRHVTKQPVASATLGKKAQPLILRTEEVPGAYALKTHDFGNDPDSKGVIKMQNEP